MPIYRDCYIKEVDGKYIEFVTISLEEYRSLVSENAQYAHRIDYLENRLLEEIEKRQKEGADNG